MSHNRKNKLSEIILIVAPFSIIPSAFICFDDPSSPMTRTSSVLLTDFEIYPPSSATLSFASARFIEANFPVNKKLKSLGSKTSSEDTLEFGDQSDWRVPNQDALSLMIVGSQEDGATLNYINPNCQSMIGSDGFVLTENALEPGKKVQGSTNFGIRCVRDVL